jgi:uncharacterized protein YkwD
MVLSIILMLFAFPGVSLAAVSYTADEIEIVRLINDYRVANGLDPVLVSDVLSDSAEKHSHDMAKYHFWGHVTVASDWFTPGSIPSQRMVACGYPPNHWTGENISGGWDTPESMLTAWKQSEGHNKNMLDPKWTVVGIGLVVDSSSDMGTYCTTDFGSFVDGTAHQNGSTLPPDTTPPTVVILQPIPGAEVNGSVTVWVDASDNRGVARVDLYANGSAVASDTASPYAIVWDSRTVPNGSCVLEVRAYDTSGNKGVATCEVRVTGSFATTTSTTTTTTSATTTTSTTTSTTTTSTTSTTSTTGSTTTTVPQGAGFADVPRSHAFYEPIMALARLGIVSGYPDGLFRPSAPVTRAQFTKIIVLALDEHTLAIDNEARPTFTDVLYAGIPYPFDYVEEASALRIITGYSDGTFAPSKKVTRLQLALMVVRAGGEDLPPAPDTYICPFSDVPAAARDEVAIAVFNGILSGKSAHVFDPYSPATRGQVAKIVYALCKILQKVQ